MAGEKENRLNIAIKCLQELKRRGCTADDVMMAWATLSTEEKFQATPSNKLEGDELEWQVAHIFKDLGISPRYKGYQYLNRAISLIYKDKKRMNAITRDIYPSIAKEFGTTWQAVEHAIRHAIVKNLNRCNLDTIQKYFGNTISPHTGKPTNSEFIAMVVDHLRLNS